MDRRHFLGAVAASAALAGTGTVATEEPRIRAGAANGRAVDYSLGPTSATLLWRVNTDRPIAALTFDDGPDPRFTPAVLAALDDHDTVATFFMQGSHVDRYPGLVRAVAERHAVGNHSYTHPNLGVASSAFAHDELSRTHEAVTRVTGTPPVAFRPPYGHLSGATGMVAADLGYDIVLWSDRISSRKTPARNVELLDQSLGPGGIILAHDGGTLPNQAVVDALPSVLTRLAERGIELASIHRWGGRLRVAYPRKSLPELGE